MKKLALILAIALIAAFSVPAYAELNIGGSYRMTADSLDTGAAKTQAFFQQRFRLPFTWTVNDNITGFIRTDWSEEAYWGTGNLGGSTDTIYVDYAWVKIQQSMWNMTVGMQEVLLGNWSAFDSDQEGITIGLDFSPVAVTLAYGKLSEGASKFDDGANGDTDSYGAELKYSTDTFTVGGLFAMAVNDPADSDLRGYGLFFNAAFGAVTLKGEIDIFNGEASPTVDFEGMNVWADVKFAASDAISLGLMGFFSEGGSTTDNKIQVSTVSSTGGSFLLYDYLGALQYDEGCYNWGTTLMQNGGMADGVEAGIFAIKGYGTFKASDAVTVHAVLGYATPDESVALDSKIYAIGSLDYAWMPNVTVSVGAAYIAPDYSDATDDDPLVQYLARLGVNF